MSRLDPINYLPGGLYYDISANSSAVVGPGLDPLTDNNLNMVYSDNYAARVNNSYNDYSVSVISQTVNNYTDPYIYFAWAAVLQASHGPTDSDNFRLKLTDDTTNTTLYDVTYNSANTPPGLFTQSNSGWFYTQWQVHQLDVSALSGDTFTLTLLGSDCPYGGHAGLCLPRRVRRRAAAPWSTGAGHAGIDGFRDRRLGGLPPAKALSSHSRRSMRSGPVTGGGDVRSPGPERIFVSAQS